MIRVTNIAAAPEVQENMARDVLDQVREVLPPESIESLTLTARLDELGLDSLGLMAAINRIEEHFGMRFPEEWLYDIETCQDVVACVIAKQTRRKPDFTLGSRPSQGQPAGKVEVASNGKIPPAAYDVSQFPECVAFEERLKLGVAAGLQNPFFRINQQVQTPEATIGGRPVVRYTSYDYLGLAAHPEVMAAAEAAIHRFGTSASASRLVGGEHVLLAELDQALARFLRTEAAIVFPSGYGTNASLLAHLFGPEDVILYDELAHNSIAQGVQLSQAKHRTFAHNDYAALDRLLHDVRGQYRRAVVAIEGVYSMDGDYPDLPEFLEVKMRHKALLYVDEAHSLGTLGRTGRGVCEHFGVDPVEGDLWMGTISKSLASFGGYLAGRASLIRYLKYTTPGLVFSAASPPATAAAALAAAADSRVRAAARRAAVPQCGPFLESGQGARTRYGLQP